MGNNLYSLANKFARSPRHRCLTLARLCPCWSGRRTLPKPCWCAEGGAGGSTLVFYEIYTLNNSTHIMNILICCKIPLPYTSSRNHKNFHIFPINVYSLLPISSSYLFKSPLCIRSLASAPIDACHELPRLCARADIQHHTVTGPSHCRTEKRKI